MLDVCTLAKKAWDIVDEDAIARCWLRARCLPSIMEADLNQLHSRTKKSGEETDVLDLLKVFETLAIQGENLDAEQGAADEFNEWVDVEESEEGRLALLSSLVDEEDD